MQSEKNSASSAGPWRKLIPAALLLTVLFAVSCSTQKSASSSGHVILPENVAIPTQVPVFLDGDSVLFRALLRCDENGRVLMDALYEEKSKGMQTKLKLDSLGNLEYNAVKPPDTVYVHGKDSLIYIPVDVEKRVEVNVLTWGQQAWIYLGKILSAVCCLGIILAVIKRRLKTNKRQ